MVESLKKNRYLWFLGKISFIGEFPCPTRRIVHLQAVYLQDSISFRCKLHSFLHAAETSRCGLPKHRTHATALREQIAERAKRKVANMSLDEIRLNKDRIMRVLEGDAAAGSSSGK